MKAISILGGAVLLACGPGAIASDAGEGSSTGAGSTAALDLAVPDLPPPGPTWRSVSAGFAALCAVREPDGALVCRDPACDAGLRPDAWALDDPACWRPTAMPAGEYAQVEVEGIQLGTSPGRVCGLTVDGALECDPPTAALPDDVYTAIGVDFSYVCGLGTHGAACVAQHSSSELAVPDAIAVDRGVLLVPDGILPITGPTLLVPGEFVAATGSYFSACGQRPGGGWTCANPDHEQAIAERGALDAVELATVGGPEVEANGCGLDAAGHARCWGRLRDRERSFVQLTVGAIPAQELYEEAAIPYACGVRDDGTLECWGPHDGWCGVALCAQTHFCEGGACVPCGEGGCEPCGELTCSNGERCLEPGVCRDCGGGSCHACACEPSDPFCDAELSLCLCGTQCDAGTCRYVCPPQYLTCGAGCNDGASVYGDCVDGWCID